jgi:hypothetical protein
MRTGLLLLLLAGCSSTPTPAQLDGPPPTSNPPGQYHLSAPPLPGGEELLGLAESEVVARFGPPTGVEQGPSGRELHFVGSQCTLVLNVTTNGGVATVDHALALDAQTHQATEFPACISSLMAQSKRD